MLVVVGLPSGVATAVDGTSVITGIAGTGTPAFSGDGGPASAAALNQPRDSAVGPDGSVYVTDTYNHRIRRISPDGTISTIAGNGSATYNGDGIPATSASLSWPHDVAVAPNGVVYIADSNHHRIREVDLDGVITTVFGTGVSGNSGDGGPGTQARIKNPKSVVVHDGGLFIADLSNRVRRLDLATGLVTAVAGTGTASYSGDGGPATAATLNSPQRLAIDSAGNIFVADTLNHAVRRIDASTGLIDTVAGTGVTGFSGDGGPAVSARLATPRGVALEGDDTLYIADSNNHRVRKVDLRSGLMSTIAGSSRGYSGDGGPAKEATFYQPRGLTVDATGRLLIADTFNSVLRVVTPASSAAANQAPSPSFSAECQALACTVDGTATTDPEGDQVTYSWSWGDGTEHAGSASSAHTYAAAGEYAVTLTATDTSGSSASTTRTLTASAPTLSSDAAFRTQVSAAGNLLRPSVTTPAAVAAGDRMLLFLSANANVTIAGPSGWTLVGAQSDGSREVQTRVWTRLAASADAGTAVRVTLGARAKFDLTLAAYSGIDPTAPIAGFASAAETAFRTNHATPLVPAATGGDLLLSYWADKTSTSEQWTPPQEQVTRAEVIGQGAGRVNALLADSRGGDGGFTAVSGAASKKAVMWSIVLAAG